MTQSLPPVTVARARTAIQADIQDYLNKPFGALPADLAARVEAASGAILIDSQLDKLTYDERCARDLLRGYTEIALRWNESTAEQRNNTAIAADESSEMQARYILQVEQKRADGRYNLDEAAMLVAGSGDVSEEQILAKLSKAAQQGALMTYMPGSKASNDYKDGTGRFKRVDTYYDECYWEDLNRWMAEYEPRIRFQFSAPSVPHHSEIGPTHEGQLEAGLLRDQIKAIAVELYGAAKNQGWGTDKDSISKALETACAERGITTLLKKRLTSAYISRHMLTPWDIPLLAEAKGQK